MRIIFATGNMGKLREAAEILGEGYNLVSPLSMGITEDVEETGKTLKDNSLLKASHIHSFTGENCFADDTGLEVDALGGAPGVHTARYAGKGHDFSANIDKLLGEMESFERRTARFRSVITLILNGETHFFEGVLEGSISRSRSGIGGFGYDPVFIPDYLPCGEVSSLTGNSGEIKLRPNTDNLTLAEISEEEKNIISHRGLALREMAAWLNNRGKER